jgi:hypothetical protein
MSPLLRNLTPFAPQSNYAIGIYNGDARPAGYVNHMFRTVEQAAHYAYWLENEAKAFYETDDVEAMSGISIKVVKIID